MPSFTKCRQSFLLVVLLCFSYSLHAQRFDAGILAGVSTTQVDGDNLAGFNKAGFKAGGFLSRKFGNKTAVQFEIEFIQKGSRRPLNDNNEYYLMRLNYIDVPLMFNYYIGKKWNLEGGIAFAVLLSSYEETEAGEILNAPEFNSMDYLLCLGGNYFFTDHLFFNVRYSYSVTPIRYKRENYSSFYFIGGQYNEVLAFTLGYKF